MLDYQITDQTDSKTYQDALQIRRCVFVEEQHVDPQLEIDDKEKQCLHIVGYDKNKKPAAAARLLFSPPSSYLVQRVAVLKEERGKAYGRELMQKLEEIARKKGASSLVLGAQNQAIPFYEKIGFSITGPEYTEAGIKHRPMSKKL